jgi:hypothetical protein
MERVTDTRAMSTTRNGFKRSFPPPRLLISLPKSWRGLLCVVPYLVSRMCLRVSFSSPPGLRLMDTAMRGGSWHRAVKYEKGATFARSPRALMEDTNAIGRGTTAKALREKGCCFQYPPLMRTHTRGARSGRRYLC